LHTQVRNIETQYGRSMAEWTELIRASGLEGHGRFSHRVRVRSSDDVDAGLATWVRRAYDRAG
jgi:hypothetical protein